MPIYEYRCSACRKKSSALLRSYSSPDPACPNCGKRLGGGCPHCGRALQPGWNFCPYCARSTAEPKKPQKRLRERDSREGRRELPAANIAEFKK